MRVRLRRIHVCPRILHGVMLLVAEGTGFLVLCKRSKRVNDLLIRKHTMPTFQIALCSLCVAVSHPKDARSS